MLTLSGITMPFGAQTGDINTSSKSQLALHRWKNGTVRIPVSITRAVPQKIWTLCNSKDMRQEND
jgi:hypothetical protein